LLPEDHSDPHAIGLHTPLVDTAVSVDLVTAGN
jgi:hypothetical protein